MDWMGVEKAIENLKKAVSNIDNKGAENAVKEYLDAGGNPLEAIDKLQEFMVEIGKEFETGVVFLPQLIMCSDIMKASVDRLMSEVPEKERRGATGKFLIGTIEGDVHDIGKGIVSIMLTVNGFEVVDLGKDVPIHRFVEKVKELKPDIVGASAMMTVTMPSQKLLIEALKSAGLRDKVKVMVGGAPVSEAWVEKIGADAYGADAVKSVAKARELLGR